jgi:exodeoxyribonuclease VII large subunit
MVGWLNQQLHQLEAIRARPSLADPRSGLEDRSVEIEELRARTRRCLGHQLHRAGDDLTHQLARVRSLSPLATLERGYAVLHDNDGHVVTSVEQAHPDQSLHVRVHDGRVHVTVRDTSTEESSP